MTRLPTALLLFPVAALLTGCDRYDLRDCSAVDLSGAAALPERLSETGLYSDIADQVFSEQATAFTPRFPLWTDSAKKRRWLLLPEGGQVDTSDPEAWRYPVGTRTFKEFIRDEIRIETRMNLKTDAGWAAAAYVWNEAGDDALRQMEALPDAAGTAHDVPGAAECHACHAGREEFTLGFSATQLDLEAREALYDAGVLSDPVEGELSLSAEAEAGLGVLHGNCAHCHNDTRDALAQATECYDPGARNAFDLTLPHDLDAQRDAPALLTARDQLGSVDDSKVLKRMTHRELDVDWPAMPPLGTERVDDEGVAAVTAFIESL